MNEWIGRLIAWVFLGSFCLAGPLLVLLSLATTAQRVELLITGVRGQGTVIGWRQSGSSPPAYAPVFQFNARDGRTYTASSDFYGKQRDAVVGAQVPVVYPAEDPSSARIDAFVPLWVLPLVTGAVGAGFCVVPAIMWVAWLRRRAAALEPQKQAAALRTADAVSRGFKRLLGAVLIAGAAALLARGVGLLPNAGLDPSARVLADVVGVLLLMAGLQVGGWVAVGSRAYHVVGSVLITAMAAMFGWVAVCGDGADFHGAAGVNGLIVPLASAPAPARVAFALAAVVAGLAALWGWKQVLRPR